jgi:hypothetical protein
MKANARMPWTIHRVTFMHASFPYFYISMSNLALLNHQASNFFDGGC